MIIVTLLCIVHLNTAFHAPGLHYRSRRSTQIEDKTTNEPVSLVDAGKSSFYKYIPTVVSIVGATLSSRVLADSYLTEPTAEFKDELKKVQAFNAAQQKIRADWDKLVGRLVESEVPSTTAGILNEMAAFLAKTDGLPAGVKKLDLVKTCRKKKFNGRKILPNWTTEVEIAYEKMIQQYNRNTTPGTLSKEIF